ncbi:MAG: T9SS type A sorting domain-containing protein [Flavobacteriales bacterium]|nr:T9SS type A sorting domain-containing protein [Flavobacteriales bacterium]
MNFSASLLSLFLLFSFSNSYAQLSDCWAPSEWSVYPGSTTEVPVGWAIVEENSIVLQESYADIGTGLDDFSCASIEGVVKACIEVPVSGDITFDWAIPGISPLWSAGSERFGVCVDGVATMITSLDDAPPFGTGSGTETISVEAGSEFCFVFESKWGQLIPWTVELTNIEVPQCASLGPLSDCWGTSNWSNYTENTTGSVTLDPNSILFVEDGDQVGSGLDILDCASTDGTVTTCITIPVTGDFTFDWELLSPVQFWSPFVERFGYCIDGVATELTSADGGPFGTTAGTETVFVTQGQEFCFILATKWADLAPLEFLVDNISVPACDGCELEPVVDISPFDEDDIYCPGDVLILSTQVSDSYQWYYNFSDSNTGGTQFPGGTTQSIELSASEWAVVYFYVESTVGDCTVASPTVVWDGWNFLSPSISHPSLLEYCEGEVITISNAFPGPVFFQWYQDGTPIPGATNSNYEVTESGTYVLEAAYGECPDFFLSSGVGPTFTFNEGMVPTISQIDFTLESSTATSYVWSLDGNVIPGATDQTYTPTENGMYTVTIIDSNGCEATSDPFNFILSGLEDVEKDPFQIYYNSSEHLIYIEGEGRPIGIISVYNEMGQLLERTTTKKSQIRIDVSSYSSGLIYMVLQDHGRNAVFQISSY